MSVLNGYVLYMSVHVIHEYTQINMIYSLLKARTCFFFNFFKHILLNQFLFTHTPHFLSNNFFYLKN